MSDLVPTVIGIVVMVLILALIGALVSLVVLLPPLRKLGRRSIIMRMTEVFIIALLSLVISFGLWTRLGAEIAYIFSTIGPAPWQEGGDPYRSAIVKELWVRSMMPPPLRRFCYSEEAIVCQRADWYAPDVASGDWGLYLQGIGMCLIASLVSSLLVWLFTRQQQG